MGLVQNCQLTGKNTEVYLKLATEPVGSYVMQGCIFTGNGPGIEYDTIVGEQCLNSAGDPTTSIGSVQADEVTFTTGYCPGSTEYTQLETWAKAGTAISVKLEFPQILEFINITEEPDKTIAPQQTFDGVIRVMKPQGIERDSFMKADVTVLRTSDWTTVDAS
jgi:hypothetical protein